MSDPRLVPAPVDAERANAARMYDYHLGGAQNFAVDREVARAVLRAYPHASLAARANRGFLRATVRYAFDHGVHQFLDLGSGIPTVGNVHEIARAHDPGTRVAYVDNESVAVAHATALLADVPGVTMTRADLCDPAAVLAAPGVTETLDLARPVAVLLVASLHFVPGDARPVVDAYRRAVAPGSVLAISHASADYPDDPELGAAMTNAAAAFADSETPLINRTHAEIRALFGDAQPAEPGLVDVARWAADGRTAPLGIYAAVSAPLR